MSGIENIAGALSEEALIEQLVEECGELVQAGAKRLRILRGENPSPKSLIDNGHDLMEELVDVLLAEEVLVEKLGCRFDCAGMKQRKLDRWLSRLGRKAKG